MKHIPNVTLAIVDCVNYDGAINAMMRSLNEIKPEEAILFTDLEIEIDLFHVQKIPKIKSKEEYSEFVIKELYKFVDTTHCLIAQFDGYVLDGTKWNDEFMEVDYVGARWRYNDEYNIGNGGFSLRSEHLMSFVANDPLINITHPEDEIICRLYGQYLRDNGFKFADEEMANKFSYEMNAPNQATFGFHQLYHDSYRPPIVLKRSGAMGDIIMLEPLMQWVDSRGCQVFLDIPEHIMPLFAHLPYKVRHVKELVAVDKVVKFDFDMAYENTPKQHVIQSYYEHIGKFNGVVRNPNLNFRTPLQSRLFRKYAIVHINKTDMPYRNIYGVDWVEVESYLRDEGYEVIQVGDDSEKCGTWVNSSDIQMLLYLIGGASIFIGSDSGPAHIAIAGNVPSVIFFGSVNPEYRIANFENISIMQGECPKAGCYHTAIGVRGVKCLLEENPPRCSVHRTEDVIHGISRLIKKQSNKMAYHSEAEKIKDKVSKYISGQVYDIGCGDHKITDYAIGVDGRALPGVGIVTNELTNLSLYTGTGVADVVFSSHCLEHIEDDTAALRDWARIIKKGGYLILYLPSDNHYDNDTNFEHVRRYTYRSFHYFFTRLFCGVLKNFKGENIDPVFELVDSGEHVGDDLYSFYIVARKL